MDVKRFDPDSPAPGGPLVLSGSKDFARAALEALEACGIRPDFRVGLKGEGRLADIPALSWDGLRRRIAEDGARVLLGMAGERPYLHCLTRNPERRWRGWEAALRRAGCTELYRLDGVFEKAALYRKPGVSDSTRWQHDLRQEVFHRQTRAFDGKLLELLSLDVQLTERCSLRCAKCANLMQYYAHPRNYPADEVIADARRVLDSVDYVYDFRLLGGEPLVYPELVRIIDAFADDDRVGTIHLISNATIAPSDELAERLSLPKMRVTLSDYGERSRHLGEFSQKLEELGVWHRIARVDAWQDCGDLRKRGYSPAQISSVYRSCECKDLVSISDGRLFCCPRVANAAALGAMTAEDIAADSLDLRAEGGLPERGELRAFLFERPYLVGCDYCDGRNTARASCEPAVQASGPLPYERLS